MVRLVRIFFPGPKIPSNSVRRLLYDRLFVTSKLHFKNVKKRKGKTYPMFPGNKRHRNQTKLWRRRNVKNHTNNVVEIY